MLALEAFLGKPRRGPLVLRLAGLRVDLKSAGTGIEAVAHGFGPAKEELVCHKAKRNLGSNNCVGEEFVLWHPYFWIFWIPRWRG